MNLQVNLGARSYDIVIERGCLRKAGEYLNLARKVLVVTDTGVPAAYAQTVAGACREAVICTMEQGEEHKTLQSLEKLLSAMLAAGFSRKDCVVAVGGGICGDLAGFAAASYMRGIDFYNIPTTVLSHQKRRRRLPSAARRPDRHGRPADSAAAAHFRRSGRGPQDGRDLRRESFSDL